MGVEVGLEADLRIMLQVGVEEGPEAGLEGAQVASLVGCQVAGLVGSQEFVQRCLAQSAVQVVRFTQHLDTFTLDITCSLTFCNE